MHVTAIIVAAGIGARMGGPVNKHLLPICGRPVLMYTLEAFERCPLVNDIVLVGGRDRLAAYRSLADEYGFTKVRAIVPGGDTRQESVICGMATVTDADVVVTHDGARPLVSQRVIVECIQQAMEHGAAIAAVPAKDTIKTGTEQGFVAETLPRQHLWQVQTPQAFRTEILRRAQQAAQGFVGTDDSVLVERLGLPVKIVMGDYSNIKITTADDLVIAEHLLHRAQEVQGAIR